MLSNWRARTLSLLLIEGMLAVLCGVGALFIRFGSDAPGVLVLELGWLKILLSTVVVQGSFYLFDLYDLRMIRKSAVLMIRILQALGLASIALATIFYVVPQLTIGRG